MSQATKEEEPIMSTVTATPAAPADHSLPVADENGREVFTVEYRDLYRKELVRAEFDTELAAVRRIGAVELYANLVPVAYGPNIDRSKFRH